MHGGRKNIERMPSSRHQYEDLKGTEWPPRIVEGHLLIHVDARQRPRPGCGSVWVSKGGSKRKSQSANLSAPSQRGRNFRISFAKTFAFTSEFLRNA